MPTTFAQSDMEEAEFEYRVRLTVSSGGGSLRIEQVVVDTGFTGEISLPISYIPLLYSQGFRIYRLGPDERVMDGSGREIPGDKFACSARLESVQRHVFADSGVLVEVLIQGIGDPLVGLKTLTNWIAKFDGPNKLLSLLLP